jgi:co-chaperonin GroES (HSP10)
MENTIKPIGDRITLKMLKMAPKVGSILIPESARKPMLYGIVMEIGPDVRSGWLLPNATVVYDQYAGTIVDKENDIMLLKEDDIYGVLTEDEADVT